MSHPGFVARPMTDAEYAEMKAGFDTHTRQHNNPVEVPERYGFVVLYEDNFIGCSSGLAYKSADDGVHCNWFYLTDLFIHTSYRKQDLGKQVLRLLEQRVAALGTAYIWTWTAGYEAPGFYKKQGYEVIAELPQYYRSGHSRIALQKALQPAVPPSP